MEEVGVLCRVLARGWLRILAVNCPKQAKSCLGSHR